MWTQRCQYYLVGTDIIPPWRQPFVSFKAGLLLMTLSTGLENSYRMLSCMLHVAKESWGVVIVSTSSARHDYINRMACVNVRDHGLLLQNLVTYEAEKNVEFL